MVVIAKCASTFAVENSVIKRCSVYQYEPLKERTVFSHLVDQFTMNVDTQIYIKCILLIHSEWYILYGFAFHSKFASLFREISLDKFVLMEPSYRFN